MTGVTPMDTSVVGVTVNGVVPAFPETGSVAVIVMVPVVLEMASPLRPAALLMVAIVSLEDVQDMDDVRFCVVRSVNMPVARNC